MGLDMYLYRRKKFRDGDKEYNKLAANATEEVAYWRKANQIRQWLVNHTELKTDDNCKRVLITKENLINLRDDCKNVIEDPVLSEKLLPTSKGFFFGDQEYGDSYFWELEYTIEKIDEILRATDFEKEVIEYFEWW